MKIAVVGTGYVGLVSGTCFAEMGVDVTCVDIDVQKIENLKKGIIPIWEPGLEDMVLRNVNAGRLHFTTSVEEVLDDVQVVFSAVGTPPGDDGSADLKFVMEVARTVGRKMNNYVLLVTKSTVPVGTAKLVRKAIQEELDKRGLQIDFDVASNPEFLKEGNAVDDFLKPDRIVVGVESEAAEKVLKRLYKPFVLNSHPIIVMDITSAEMTKYAANAMLATKISFINDIVNLCEIVGADINLVRKGIGSDSRIGNKFLYPGVGYGGSCFPKDVQALVKTASEYDYNLRVLKAVEEVNYNQKSVLYNKIYNYFGGNLQGKHIALWGLSFKPETDDMREAPSLTIIDKLLEQGAQVTAYDPIAIHEAHRILGDKIKYAKDMYDALVDADALAVVTEWSEFRLPNFKVMAKLMNEKVLFDGRNVFDIEQIEEFGFKYFSIGRKPLNV